jgi:hypothetical protein
MLLFWGFDFAAPGDEGFTGVFQRSTSNVRTGSHSLETGGVGTLSATFSNIATCYIGMAFRPTSLAAHPIISLYDGGTAQITVTRESDGSLAVRRGGAAGTILAQSSAGVLNTANAWHHLQLGVTVHGSTGSVELRKEGVAVASASGANTSASGNNRVNNFLLTGPAGAQTCQIDDLWVSDSAFQGDCKVETIYPTADGATNNWAANGAASRYQCVDETGANNGDTDYLSSGQVDDLQLFGMGNLTATQGTVKGGKFSQASKKDDSGTRAVATVVRSNNSNNVRSDNTLSTSYVIYSEVLTQDPTDSAAWTIAKANDVQVGVKVTV